MFARFGKLTPRKHICNIWGWGKFDKLSLEINQVVTTNVHLS